MPIRRYLITGLLAWVPLGITVLVIRFIVNLMDRTLLLLPGHWRPDALLGFHVPGLGIVLALLVLFITGAVTANFVGRRLMEGWEHLLSRIPLVRSIYSSVKQVMQSLLATGSTSFRKVLLIEYPRKGLWTLGFQTGSSTPVIEGATGREVVTVFIPTTPNPTSGFIIMVPREDAVDVDMSVEEGLKLIMSLGVVTPAVASAQASA